jgi:transmembrane sensor
MNTEIIANYLSGNATAEQRAAVDAWRKEGDNEKVFSSYRKTWELAANDKESVLPDTERAWQKVSREIEKPANTEPIKMFHWLAAAAVLIVPVLLYALLFNKPAAANVQQVAAVSVPSVLLTEVYTTDSLVQFYLPDSSRVLLNKNSRLSFPEKFEGRERTVKLTGEAFFEIKKDPTKPFMIEAGSSLTKVTGTSFNLKAHKTNEVELTVVTGTVEFSAVSVPGRPKLVVVENNRALLKDKELSAVKRSAQEKEWWRERKKNRFKKFLGKIKKIFKKEN